MLMPRVHCIPPQVDLLPNMKSVLNELLEWSQDRPVWQRDALRRLVLAGSLSLDDLAELFDLCKAAHGLVAPKASQPLATQHVAVPDSAADTVSLESVTHHRGVNALANEQTVKFGPNLTIVYGQNAAGKSGYTRILKRACRTRGVEDILGNVLSGDAPLKPHATIRYRNGSAEASLDWTPDAELASIAGVSVFDSHCVPVYLRNKTDVAFRPFGLDIFDKLSTACGDVRAFLEAEQSRLNAAAPSLPIFQAGTAARTLIDGLTALTKIATVEALATLTASDEERLCGLRERVRDLQAADPKQRARDLNLKAARLTVIDRHIGELDTLFGDSNLTALQTTADEVRAAKDALALVRTTALTADLLPGTGERVWRGLWEAAAAFSTVAYPDTAFPVLETGARCPLCQQAISPDAAGRLRHLAEYIESRAQSELRTAEGKLRAAVASVDEFAIEPRDVLAAIDEFAGDNSECAMRAKECLTHAAQLREEVKAAVQQNKSLLQIQGLGQGPAEDIRKAAASLLARAEELQSSKSALDAKEAAELQELEARVALKDHLSAVVNEIERKKRIAAYRQCLDDTSTQAITRKSTELTKERVTGQLRSAFKDELTKIAFTHLLVEVQAAGGAKGALFHRLVFSNAPGVVVTDVLSEGESRALSLAAFLAELSTATTRSAIIFDDPVSSLDHVWREKIAQRLVTEAGGRQVIVFTHDILFLRLLIDFCRRGGVVCNHQYVRREGHAGVCSPDLPWAAMGVKDRIGSLRSRWQAAEKVRRTSTLEAYEGDARAIYGLLREAWEQAVGEVLLNDVVERYRPSIETQKARFLHDITAIDCNALDEAVTECSRWFRGHDQAAADGTPLPEPAEIQRRINDLETWVKTIRTRRSK